MGYFLAAFLRRASSSTAGAAIPAFAPGVSILKSLKGLDPGMMDALPQPLPAELHGRI